MSKHVKSWIKRGIFIIVAILIAGLYSYGIWSSAIYDTSIGSSAYEYSPALFGNDILEQRFRCGYEGLCGINIKISKLNHEKIGDYYWYLIEAESDKEIASGKLDDTMTKTKNFDGSNVQKRGMVSFKFDVQKNSKNREYILRLVSSEVMEENSLSMYITESGKYDKGLSVNGQILDKSCVIKMQYQRFNLETFIVFLGVILYMVVFIKFMYKLFR